jgi:hypothetical protein
VSVDDDEMDLLNARETIALCLQVTWRLLGQQTAVEGMDLGRQEVLWASRPALPNIVTHSKYKYIHW